VRTRLSLIALSLTGLAILAPALSSSPAGAATTNEIAVYGSSHCLDDDTNNAANLQMWSCTGGTEQHWTSTPDPSGLYTFQNAHTGLCITAPATAEVVPLALAGCTAGGSALQQWRVFAADNPPGGSGWYEVFQNVADNWCLRTSSVGNGTNPEMWPCDASISYERWQFR
jgi:hypothetical protein